MKIFKGVVDYDLTFLTLVMLVMLQLL